MTTTPQGTSTHVVSLPDCDIHTYEKHTPGITAHYDGKTKVGPWAHMCPSCFETYGVGLGVGLGQHLVLKTPEPDPEWEPGPPCSHCGGPTLAPEPGTDEEGFYCEACGEAWRDTGRV